MNTCTHDPREQIHEIHQILISDKKHIGLLFEAGTSLATGINSVYIPAIADMTTKIMSDVSAQSTEFAGAIKGTTLIQIFLNMTLKVFELHRPLVHNSTEITKRLYLEREP